MAAHIASTAREGSALLIGSFTLRCIKKAPSMSTPMPTAAGCARLGIQSEAEDRERKAINGKLLAQGFCVLAAIRGRLATAQEPDVQNAKCHDEFQSDEEVMHGVDVGNSTAVKSDTFESATLPRGPQANPLPAAAL